MKQVPGYGRYMLDRMSNIAAVTRKFENNRPEWPTLMNINDIIYIACVYKVTMRHRSIFSGSGL